jgi:hypothetical protein
MQPAGNRTAKSQAQNLYLAFFDRGATEAQELRTILARSE